jgi:hypothetical protein
MSIASSSNAGRPAPRRLGRSPRLVLLASMAVVLLGAQDFRRAPKFEGKMIPEPPSQGQPWSAPATTLPKFLVNSTGILFEQGVADPRGCEYRLVEISNGSIVKARGFVLPERSDPHGRFVICWDGQVYPVLTLGDPADLDRDIKDLAVRLKRSREAGNSNRFAQGIFWGFPGERQSFYNFADVDDLSPIKLCLLLRLGRADLAETLFAAGTIWTPGPRARDLTAYGISYLTLANNWAASAFGRLVGAHMKGDDVIALDTARKLARFRDLAVARADAMGFPQVDQENRTGNGPALRFSFLNQLDDLLRDQERRARMPAREPIPRKGGDPSARIAALIRDLDQIDEQPRVFPSAASPGRSLLVKDLIAEGDPAVAPLLEVLVSDNRLTRSVSRTGRGLDSPGRLVHPVHEAAFAALIGILNTREFDDQRFYSSRTTDPATRKAVAGSIRQFWEKTRSVPLVERWYRTLLDDSAGSARWLEAAGGIVRTDVKEGMPIPKPGTRPLKGEPLRVGRDPSVTALMLRRARQIERMGDPQSSNHQGLAGACQMASILVSWDEQASLPLLKTLMKECRAESDRWRDQEKPQNPDQNLASSLAGFTQVRLRLGDLEALDEYAAWLRTTSPKMLEYGTFQALQPLLADPDQPTLASAARWLFNDPKSPWVPLLPEARGQQAPPFQSLFASPLIIVAGFREGVLTGLADKSPLGTIEKIEKGSIRRKIKNVPATNSGSSFFDLEGVAIGVEHPFRYCDYLASILSGLEGCPRCDLFWPEARRDEAVAACVAYLKRYSASFTTETPAGIRDFPESKVHLKFPILGKPATPEDIASARAIFSLEGQGEVRLASMPGLPQQARWVTLKDRPVDRTSFPDGITRREYDTDGYVWQAEEVRKGDGWERFYGFVGHHVVARVPASEIEFASQFSPWWNLKGGMDARTELVEPRTTGYEPGRPVLVSLHIRNRLGVARSSPTEFIRPGPDGKPALRKGVNLSLWRSASRRMTSDFNHGYPNDVVEPKRDAHFDPGQGSRLLSPLEAFEAMRFELNDWFDLTKPGRYRLRVTFAADSGLGEGSASEVNFQVGGDE